MLVARKRARESESPLLRGPQELLAFKAHAAAPAESQRLLKDLGDGRGALAELLARLHEREPAAHDDAALEMARARLSSQELFLSVVLEWQRCPEPVESPTAALFRHDRAFLKDEASYASSSSGASSYAPSDDERENDVVSTKRSRQKVDVSPTSVHNVPGALTPLRLDAHNSPSKRIGIYTPRARQELLRKYMAKRARRLSQNTVRYGVRKTLANARPRVKGRFVKTETPLTAALVQKSKTD